MTSQPVLAFGPYRLDARDRSLTRDGNHVALGARALDVLAVLASADGQFVGKDALLDQVWSRVAVAENNLHAQISALRKALGDAAIVTVPGRGYRLALAGRAVGAAPLDVAPWEDMQAAKPSVAVLPFASLAGDAAEQYFAHGMAEELTTALGRIRSFLLIVPPVGAATAGGPADARQAARQLGVRYVVEGSVRSDAGKTRVLVRLAEAATGQLLWTERIEGTTDDVFALQDRVTARVAAAIAPRIIAAEIAHAQCRHPSRPRPYDLLLAALSQYGARTRAGTEGAIRLLRRAVVLDPGYALAHAHLANNLWWMIAHGWLHADDPIVGDMLVSAEAALALDPENPEVLLLVSVIICSCGNDLDGGIAKIECALDLNPYSAVAFRLLGVLQSYAGEPAAAFASLERADRLNPFNRGLMPNHGHYLAHFCNGDHAAVVESTGRLLLDQPSFIPALRWRAASLGLLGEVAEGRRVVERIRTASPDFSVSWARRFIEVDMNNVFKSPGMAEAFCIGLRQSGMREG